MTEYFLWFLVGTGFKNTIKPTNSDNKLKTVAELGKEVKRVELKEEAGNLASYSKM